MNRRSESRKPNRMRNYNYSNPGSYFITICVKYRRPVFGKIRDGKMILNDLGEIAKECWENITKHFIEAEIDEFIIMPEHLHGIIIIKDTNGTNHANLTASTRTDNQNHELGIIIGSFKAAVSRWAHKFYNKNFQWQ